MWDIFTVSVTGSNHIKNNIVNQDHAEFYNDKNLSIIVLSDGLGSCKYSHIGSQAVCKAVVECIVESKDLSNIDDLLTEIYNSFINNIKPYSLKDCLATCLFVVEYDSELLVFRLGDGLILVADKEKTISIYDKKEDTFLNLTNNISDILTKEKIEVFRLNSEEIYAVLLCSDGISEDIEKEKYAEFLEEFYTYFFNMEKNIREDELYKLFSNWNVKNSDDKTLICMFKER